MSLAILSCWLHSMVVAISFTLYNSSYSLKGQGDPANVPLFLSGKRVLVGKYSSSWMQPEPLPTEVQVWYRNFGTSAMSSNGRTMVPPPLLHSTGSLCLFFIIYFSKIHLGYLFICVDTIINLFFKPNRTNCICFRRRPRWEWDWEHTRISKKLFRFLHREFK